MPHIVRTRYALGRTGWVVAALAAIRVVLPLLVLAGVAVPSTPAFEYDGLTGDATGFYAAAREFMASFGRVPNAVAAATVLAAVAGSVMLVRLRRRARGWAIVGACAVVAIVSSVAITEMHAPGAAVVGWPIVWSVPLFPYRALGLDQDGAYAVAVALSLAANAVTVVATAYAGLYATGRRAVALGAASLFAFWPLLTGLVGGERAWENGTWAVDAGLAAYTEPLSTALVTVALALLLSPRLTDVRLALAGGLLGLAATVKLTNGLLAAGALALLVARVGPRASLPFAAAGAAFLPVVAAYWPKGYPAILDEDPDAWPSDPFDLGHAVEAWSDSLLFTPVLLLLLVPLAILGALALRPAWPLRLVVLWSLLNPLVYSFYFVTALHPRFLFASLPAVFVLWALGAATVAATLSRRLRPRGDVDYGGAAST
jgi:hypothetical protein